MQNPPNTITETITEIPDNPKVGVIEVKGEKKIVRESKVFIDKPSNYTVDDILRINNLAQAEFNKLKSFGVNITESQPFIAKNNQGQLNLFHITKFVEGTICSLENLEDMLGAKPEAGILIDDYINQIIQYIKLKISELETSPYSLFDLLPYQCIYNSENAKLVLVDIESVLCDLRTDDGISWLRITLHDLKHYTKFLSKIFPNAKKTQVALLDLENEIKNNPSLALSNNN